MNDEFADDIAVDRPVDGTVEHPAPDRVLIIACGALAREILATGAADPCRPHLPAGAPAQPAGKDSGGRARRGPQGP
jgi:hypothetical protein